MRDGFLETPGIAYRTNDFDPSRKTVVFIHGLSGTSSSWWKFEDELEDSYNLVTYDLRGHGLSKRFVPYHAYDFTELAKDLYLLLTHLKLDTIILVSHSLGTSVANLFIKNHPEMVESAIFLAPNYKLRTLLTTKLFLPVLTAVNALYRLFPFTSKPGSRIDYHSFTYSPDFSVKRIVPEIKDLTPRLYLCYLEHMYKECGDAYWESIKEPTTLVHGTHDSFVPYRLAVELNTVIANSKLVTIKKGNHMLVINNAPEIIDVIKNF